MKKRIFPLLLLFVHIFLAHAGDSNVKTDLKAGKNEISIRMDDGAMLATDIYLPKGEGAFPAVIVRTPYNKSALEWIAKNFNESGIAVVVQDVRGKYKSGGEFYPFINERADGLQTLKWIRSQLWASGHITGWGGSYVGYTQWAISDSLDLLTPVLTGANLYDLVYPGGLFSLQTAFNWGLAVASKEANKIKPEKALASFNILPLSVADDSTIMDIPFLNDWILHEKYDEYWQNMDFRGKTKAPVISVAGWYDIFLDAQLKDFQALAGRSGTGSRLIVGPWCHGGQGEKNEFGGEAKTGKLTAPVDYVKNLIRGKNAVMPEPFTDKTYSLFIMERNEYVGSDAWPPRETQSVPFYIGPGSYLSKEKFMKDGALQYEYSPSDPFPSKGGTALGAGVGPARQDDNRSRKDQLVFEMKIADKPMILLGNISATLWLSSDAECTDFIVGVQDIFPDGKIINIQEGGAKVKSGQKEPQKTEISVWATGYQLNPGHHLRVVISSSWFPRFNRSLNSCEPAFAAKNMKSARQTVGYGGKTPSSVNLPVYTLTEK
ncbi:MAG TPA: CocE/NonD family hydrolase [Prolixibacteraceae bacterium]|nr:CocE/NonD family hydrolase [Prolixibacteraceae bacterium]